MAIGTAAAIIGGSLITGALASRSASKSSKAGVQAAETATAEQRRQFDITQGNIQPSIEIGNLAFRIYTLCIY